MIRRLSVGLPLVGLVVLVACSEKTADLVGVDSMPSPSFVDLDAGNDASDANDLIAYCPSDRCPPGHTTCPNSTFLCDVDLLTDPFNCGECGNACPDAQFTEEYSCVDGRCTMNCIAGRALDCDGVPDNGCEARLPDSDNCGVCGLKCPDGVKCIDRFIFDYGCGCRPGQLFCPGGPFGDLLACVDPEYDDNNCGACKNVCPRDGGGKERPPNTYFGCWESKCGELKCDGFFGDCDLIYDNGCETPLLTKDNCGGCGNRCQGDMECRLNTKAIVPYPECMCAADMTFCKGGEIGGVEHGICADLSSDSNNCGACGYRCELNMPYGFEACVYGKCQRSCSNGWADCNGNVGDGCETDISADPKNCGGCGIVCDGIAGQACVDGRCMVEPCDVMNDAGGPTR